MGTNLKVRQRTMTDLDEQMTRETALLCDWTRTMVDKTASRTLRDSWEIGKRWCEAEQRPTVYGADCVDLVESRLSLGRGELRQAMRFHQMFDKVALEKLLSLRSASTGGALRWSHIVQVLPLGNPKQALLTLMRAAKEGWTKDELAEHLSRSRVTAPHAGGRPLKIPSNLAGKLANLEKVLSVVSRNHREIWAHEDIGIVQSVRDLPSDKLDHGTVSEIAKALAVTRNAAAVLAQEVTLLEEAHELAASRFGHKAKEDAAATVAGM